MRIAVKFKRDERARYVSHLDMQRSVQRWLTRAKLPCEYSLGFNPHIVLSFACPMPVGLISFGDYFEFRITREMPTEQIAQSLCRCAPTGIEATDVFALAPNQKKLMASLKYAKYQMDFIDETQAQSTYEYIENNSEIIITNKKGNKISAKPMIYSTEISKEQITMVVNFSSEGSISPMDIVRNLGLCPEIKRLDLLTIINADIVSLQQLREI